MKYENFKRASEVVKDIDGYTDALESISDPGYLITIKASNSKNAIAEIRNGFESEYSKYAEELVEKMKKHMSDKIKALKIELETL